MRDILNLLDMLTEENLGAPQIPTNKASAVKDLSTGKALSRPALFLQKVQSGNSPFTLVSGGEVIIDPTESERVAQWIQSGPKGPNGSITLKTVDGNTIKNTDLLKTVEFGSKESETIKLKGSDVFATTDQEVSDFGNSIEQLLQAGGFPASKMYDKISSSPQMQALGQVGDAVIYMSRQANEGQVPEFPSGLTTAEIKAIELYASEYIGVLGLLSGSTKFKKGNRKDFDEFVGTNLNDMIMYFPKDSANPLADSFSVVNDETGHAIKISSKAAGNGAPPALGSLKIPAEVQEKYPEAYEFFTVATDSKLSAFTQPFEMMNWLASHGSAVADSYQNILPFDTQLMSALANSYKKNTPISPEIMAVFNKQLSQKVQDSDNTDGGKAWYAVTKDVMKAVNDQDAINGFQPAVIESLGYNFIQLYTNAKGNKLITEAFWPAKISGQVKLKTKGSAADPGKGKISVEISSGKDTGPEIGTPVNVSKKRPIQTAPDELDTVAQQRSGVTAASGGVEKSKKFSKKALGRDYQR